MEKKITYGFDYWLSELQLAGQTINPGKYTPEYNAKLEKAWRKEPLTNLVIRVTNRRKQAAEQAATGTNYQCLSCNHNQGTNDHCRKCGQTKLEETIL